MFMKFYVSGFSVESVGNNLNKVYIFSMGGSRAIQNCFDHLRTTILDDSTGSQLRCVI